MTRCSNGLKIITTPLIALPIKFIEEHDKVLKWSQNTHSSTHSYICMEFTEEYDKVLKWSQNTHNSTHSYMYGIHPKNMTRCSNDLKILTTLLIAICTEFTEEYDKVLKWSQNIKNSTHSYMYGIH